MSDTDDSLARTFDRAEKTNEALRLRTRITELKGKVIRGAALTAEEKRELEDSEKRLGQLERGN